MGRKAQRISIGFVLGMALGMALCVVITVGLALRYGCEGPSVEERTDYASKFGVSLYAEVPKHIIDQLEVGTPQNDLHQRLRAFGPVEFSDLEPKPVLEEGHYRESARLSTVRCNEFWFIIEYDGDQRYLGAVWVD